MQFTLPAKLAKTAVDIVLNSCQAALESEWQRIFQRKNFCQKSHFLKKEINQPSWNGSRRPTFYPSKIGA